ncbi:MAG: hypothetical protein ACLVHQ_01555 [Oscillospiraceae bacterium]
MVILVINGKGIPNAAKLAEMLDEAISQLPLQIGLSGEKVELNLESVIINVNKRQKHLRQRMYHPGRKPFITERIAGLEFEISPLSFYQVNPAQMQKLYKSSGVC